MNILYFMWVNCLDQMELQSRVEATQAQLQGFGATLDEIHARTVYSARSHLESAAVLALEKSFLKTVPLKEDVLALLEACEDDTFVKTKSYSLL